MSEPKAPLLANATRDLARFGAALRYEQIPAQAVACLVGMETFTQTSPETFARFLEDEIVVWGRIARDAGAKAE